MVKIVLTICLGLAAGLAVPQLAAQAVDKKASFWEKVKAHF